MRPSDPIERVFNGVAAAVVALAAAWALTRPAFVPAPKPPLPEEFVVALQAPPPEAPPAPPKPEVKTPPPPKTPPPVQKALPPPPPLPTPPLPAVVPVTPPPPPHPVQAPAPPPVVPAPAPSPAPAPAAPSPANAEASYTGKLRAYIRTITEYPTSGDARRTKPEGKVQVRFTLARAGQLRDVAVEQTSGSVILDKKAVSIVKDGAYPAMPKEIWPSEAEHAFTVTVEFVAP